MDNNVEQNSLSVQKMSFSEGISYVLKKMTNYIEERKELIAQKIEENQKEADAQREAREIQRKKDIAEYEQQTFADFLLNNQRFPDYFSMLSNGYIPTSKQEQFWKKQIDAVIFSSNDDEFADWVASCRVSPSDSVQKFKFLPNSSLEKENFAQISEHVKKSLGSLSDLIQHGIKPTEDQYVELLFTRNVLDLKEIIDLHVKNPNTKYNYFVEHFTSCVQKDSFPKKLYERFEDIVHETTNLRFDSYSKPGAYPKINRLFYSTEVLKIMPEVLFKDVSVDKYLALFSSWSNNDSATNHFKATFANILDSQYSKELDEKLHLQPKPAKRTP